MDKKVPSLNLSGLKDIIWAFIIFISLIALLVGLIAGAFTRYSGEREIRTAMLKGEKTEVVVDTVDSSTRSDGSLHELTETADAGDDYLYSLTWLTDSIAVGLRNNSLYTSKVWGSEAGNLSMANISDWKIRFSDGSTLSPAEAAMVAKPSVLVIAIGSDGLRMVTEETFISGYTQLIESILAVSPDTKIICCSIITPGVSYSGADGLTSTDVAVANEWVKTVCINTGSYYAHASESVETGNTLLTSYAGSNNKALNTTGLAEWLAWFRTHALTA